VLLLIHVTASIGWIGTVIAYLTLALAAEVGDALTRRAAWIGMEITGWSAIVPLALTSLISGVIMAAGTRWGLVRHDPAAHAHREHGRRRRPCRHPGRDRATGQRPDAPWRGTPDPDRCRSPQQS